MSPYLVPITTILTGICLWTTNVSDIIMYHCHNVSVSVTNLCLILTTYSAQSVNGGEDQKCGEVCPHKLMPKHSLLLIPSAALSYHQCLLHSSNTPRVSCTAPDDFTVMIIASSSHQCQAFPTLPHSSSLRMSLSQCRVLSTAHTSNKQHNLATAEQTDFQHSYSVRCGRPTLYYQWLH